MTFAAAAAVGPAGPVMGVDLSGEMVTLARARARERGCHHVHFERMDAEDLTLPGGLFDMALCALGLMYMPDARKAVCEMARMLAPGGRAVAAVWGAHGRGWAQILPIVDRSLVKGQTPYNVSDPLQKAATCPLIFELGTGDRLASLFRRAGLTEIVTETVDAQLEWRSADEACSAAFAAGPAAGAHSRFDVPTRLAAYPRIPGFHRRVAHRRRVCRARQHWWPSAAERWGKCQGWAARYTARDPL